MRYASLVSGGNGDGTATLQAFERYGESMDNEASGGACDLQGDVKIADGLALDSRKTHATQTRDAAVVRSAGNGEFDLSFERRDDDLGSERRLIEGDE